MPNGAFLLTTPSMAPSALALTLAACAPSTAPDLKSNKRDTADDCHGSPPYIETLTVGDGGLMTFPDSDDTAWTVRFSVDARDDIDRDLDFVTFRAWWAAGTTSPDTTLEPNYDGKAQPGSKQVCNAWKHNADQRVTLPRDDLAFATTYAFAVSIMDSGGDWSEPAFQGHTTCNADGTPGV